LKHINLISFARAGKFYPKKPPNNVCQYLVEASLILETPLKGLRESDLKKTVDDIVLDENEKFFSSQRYSLAAQIDYFLQGDFDTFEILFVCQNGLLRSRVAANTFKDWISTRHEKSITKGLLSVSVTHMELDLINQALKELSTRSYSRKIINFFHRKYTFCKAKLIVFYKKFLILIKSSATNTDR